MAEWSPPALTRPESFLAVSHAGRGVFTVSDWERVARVDALAYPEAGIAIGIGPIAGEKIAVRQIDYATGVLAFTSPDGSWSLRYSEGTLTVSFAHDAASPKG